MPLPLCFPRPADGVAVSSAQLRNISAARHSRDGLLSPSSPERIEGVFTRAVELASSSGKPKVSHGNIRAAQHPSIINRGFVKIAE